MRDPENDNEWVSIARLTRARGRRGELSAVSLSSHPERFQQLRQVVLFGGEGFPGRQRSYAVEQIWEHGARLIFKFAGVDSISEAEQLRGAEVRVRPAERFELPPGEYYHSDLVGCEVSDAESGNCLGWVDEFQEQGGNGILRVTDGESGRELLIPFVKAVCVGIDTARRRIEVRLPEGLMELNAPGSAERRRRKDR